MATGSVQVCVWVRKGTSLNVSRTTGGSNAVVRIGEYDSEVSLFADADGLRALAEAVSNAAKQMIAEEEVTLR